MFLTQSDFEILINVDDLNVITDNRQRLVEDIELGAIEEINTYIRQRYDESKVFLNPIEFSISSSYYTGDRLIWKQTAYSSGNSYNIDDYVSFSSSTDSDYIYKSLITGNTNSPLVLTGWTEVVLNNTHYTCLAQTTGGTYPDQSLFTQTTTGSTIIPILAYDNLKGWDRKTTLYFVVDEYQRTYIYNNSGDTTTGTNYIGWFPFLNSDRLNAQGISTQTVSLVNQPIELKERQPLIGYELPIIQPVYPGNNKTNFLNGYIKIVDYIEPSINWEITPTNVFYQKDSRNPLIKNLLIDIMLYHLHSRINPRNIPELRVLRYQSTLDTLKNIAKGIISIDLPTHLEKQRGANILYGSQNRMINYY